MGKFKSSVPPIIFVYNFARKILFTAEAVMHSVFDSSSKDS